MITVGIDFATTQLKVALDQGAGTALVQNEANTPRMVWLVDSQQPGGAKAGSLFQILTLRKMLDFDRAFRLPVGTVNSLDYVAKLFRATMENCHIHLNRDAARCVLAVPSCFSQRQRSSLKTAVGRAGFRQVKLVDDSLAALLASRPRLDGFSTVLVFALGAGSFSCSLHQMVQGAFRPLAQEGDRDIGGIDIDSAMLNYVGTELLKDDQAHSYINNPAFRQHIVSECDRLKIEFTQGDAGILQLDRLSQYTGINGFPSLSVPRSVYQESVDKLVQSTMALLDTVLTNTKEALPEAVLLVGKSTRLPEIRQALDERFPGKLILEAAENAVAFGAIRYGGMVPVEDWDQAKVPVEILSNSEPVRPPAMSTHPSQIQVKSSNRSSTWKDLFAPMMDKAQKLDESGRWEECLQTFEDLLDKMNDFAGSLYGKVASSWQAAGERDRALKLLLEANRRNPRNRPIAVKCAEAAFLCAIDLRRLKKIKEASEMISQAVEAITVLSDAFIEHPTFLGKLMHLQGCLLFEQNRVAEAEKILVQCIKLDPSVKEYQEHLVTVQQALKPAGMNWFNRMAVSPDDGRKKKQRPNEPCFCGSGKKYKKCHGSA